MFVVQELKQFDKYLLHKNKLRKTAFHNYDTHSPFIHIILSPNISSITLIPNPNDVDIYIYIYIGSVLYQQE